MNDPAATPPAKLSWKFPAVFWIANIAELFERAAFYGMFIALSLYLSRNVGFGDVGAGTLSAFFSGALYFLPIIMGTFADRIGFRPALILAFALLTAGYFALGAVPAKPVAVLALTLIAIGGAIVKPVISGTAAKSSDSDHRARAFSIFYLMVNIGAFSGKTVAAPLRQHLGLEYINFYASAMALLALILVVAAYRSPDRHGTGRSLEQVWNDFLQVLANGRFMCLILIIAGFWTIQSQLYASMPKYILRLMGESARPEWLANINPLVVVLCVVPITHLVRRLRPENSIAISLILIPLSALAFSFSPILQRATGTSISLPFGYTIHPVTLMAIVGIAFQGLGECFLAPKFMEFASRQAPKGQEGMYMGFQNLPTSIAWFAGFILSGFLLDAFCPDPDKLKTTDPAQFAQWENAVATGGTLPSAYAHAHYLWYVFVGIGVLAFVGLLIFKNVTARIDRKTAAIA